MKTAVGVYGLCEHPDVIDASALDEMYPLVRCVRCPAEWSEVGDRYLARPVRQGHWPTGVGWIGARMAA